MEDDEDLSLVSHDTLDTSKFSDALVRNIISHPKFRTDHDRGVVKMYLSIRKVWHDREIMPLLINAAVGDDVTALLLAGDTYMASVLRNQLKKFKGTLCPKTGDITISQTNYFLFCLGISLEFRKFGLLCSDEAATVARMAREFRIRLAMDSVAQAREFTGLNLIISDWGSLLGDDDA